MILAFVVGFQTRCCFLRKGAEVQVNGLRSHDVGQGDGEVSKNDRGFSGASTYINMHEYIHSQVAIERKSLNHSKTQVNFVPPNRSGSVQSGNLEKVSSR
jgi:hypothetical protein